MAKFYGALVGVAYAALSAAAKTTSHFHEKGTDHVLVRDKVELAAAAVNDTVRLGVFGSNAYLDPLRCTLYFDDLGATTTLDVGTPAAPQAFLTALDVSTAAGSASLFKTTDIDNWFKPLWQIVGLVADPGGQIELIATVKSSAATGTLIWSFMGQNR